MQSSNRFPRVEEPFRRVLRRNVAIATVIGLVFALLRRDLAQLLPVTVVALWFPLGGHYVELIFLNGIRNRLSPQRVTQIVARLAVWSCAGVVLYACMVTTARLLALRARLFGPW